MLTLFVMVVVMLFLQFCQGCCQSGFAFQGVENLLAGQFFPGSCDNGCRCVMLPQHFHRLIQLFLRNVGSTGQNNGGSGFYLIVIELAKVCHINFHFSGIHHRNGIAQSDFLVGDFVHGGNYIGKLTHTGGLNKNAFGMIVVDHLSQSLAEIAYETAANAAGVHLGDIDTGILQKAAVDADFAKFVFNQHQFLTGVALFNHFFNECGFTGTKEAGKNINFCHKNTFSTYYYMLYYSTKF